MKHIEPPENLPVPPEPPQPTDPKTPETETKEDVHFRDPGTGDTVDTVPVSGGNVRMDIPTPRSLQLLNSDMTQRKERSIRAPDELLTVPEVAQRLRRSRAAVYRLVEHRALTVYRIPGSYRFKVSDIDAFLDKYRTDARRAPEYDPADQGRLVD